MAGKRITTELVVKAVDKYSAKLRDMSGVTGKFAAKVRTEMGRLQDLRGPLRLIEDYKSVQATFGKSEAALRKARERLKSLRAEMKATAAPTKKMTQEFARAQRAAERLRVSHEKNKTELSQLQGKMRSAGVNTADLAGEQRRLAGALGAVNTAFGRQIERMQRLKVMQDRIAEGRKRMDRSLARSANLNFVGGASMATGRRILTGMSAPIMAAVDFESAMSDVSKVVDFESPAAFREMSDDILKMSTRIPIVASGLAEIFAAGGQSGIALEDLERFAEMAAKIGVAFDISAGRSGESMARIKTALSLTMDETGLLFDAMNHLSNNMASTAPKILNFTARVAVDGKVKGFTATETLAFGSAMIAAGAEADVAATSFRNMGKALVMGAASTPKRRAAFQSLGLEAADVARAMQEDAVGTTLDVMERINQLPKHLHSSMISQIFGDEARGLLPLIGNMDLLREALGLVAEESEYAGSAEAEYAVRAETTANKIQLLRNQATRLGITIGETVLPVLNDLLEKSQAFIETLVVWTKEHPKLTKWLVIGAAALGGMAVAGGALLTAAAGLIGTLAVLRFGLAGLGAGAIFAGGGLGGLATKFRGLGRFSKFALSKLIIPIRWGASLIPAIGWGKMSGRLGKFGMNAKGWLKLVTPLKWFARGALRLIPGIGWALMAADIGLFAWDVLGLKELPWRDYLNKAIEWKNWFFSFKWSEFLPEWSWDFITEFDISGLIKWPEPPEWLKWLMGQQEALVATPLLRDTPGFGEVDPKRAAALETVELFSPAAHGARVLTLPTDAYLQELRGFAEELRAEIAAIEGEINNLGQGPMATTLAAPKLQELDARKRELQELEVELSSSEVMSGRLVSALKVLDGSNVTPEIDMESIDRALEKVALLSAQLRSMSSSETVQISIGAARKGLSLGYGRAVTPLAGARASGGPVRAGLPYLINENTPRSEIMVPSMSGGVLNVAQAQSALRASSSGFLDGAQRVRAAGLAGLAASALVVSGGAVAAANSAGAIPPALPAGKPVIARIEINGGIHIVAPSGVSDPEGLVDLLESRLGERISATFAASFSD